MNPLDKASIIDKHEMSAQIKLEDLIARDSWEEIIQIAKGRHILGHYEYGDTNLMEWSDGKIVAAVLEELADALVYLSWLEERGNGSN